MSGELNGADFCEHVSTALDEWHQRALSDRDLADKSLPLRRFCERFAPYWLDEVAGCAAAAGVDEDD